MSIGNLKTYGNKGNNFPFQKKVLDGLSLGRLGDLDEITVSEITVLDLENAINAIFEAKPLNYLVSKNIIYDGTNYVAFITCKVLQ